MDFDEYVDSLLREIDRLAREVKPFNITTAMHNVVSRLEMVKDRLWDISRDVRRIREAVDRSGLRLFMRSYAMCAKLASELSDALTLLRMKVVGREATDSDFIEVLKMIEKLMSSPCLVLLPSTIEEVRKMITDIRWARHLYVDGKIVDATYLLKEAETRLSRIIKEPRIVIESLNLDKEQAKDILHDITELANEIQQELAKI